MCREYRDRLRRKRRYLRAKQDGRCVDCSEPTTWFASARGPTPPTSACLTMRRGEPAVVCFRCAAIAAKAAQAARALGLPPFQTPRHEDFPHE